MDLPTPRFSSKSKKKKFINASTIIIQENPAHRSNQANDNNCIYATDEDDKYLENQSIPKQLVETEKNNVTEKLFTINIYPIKMHFIRSKEPVGVGRFGVVYKASNINIKISKSEGDNFNHDHTCEILSHSPVKIMAVKIIRNKKMSSTLVESTKKTRKNTMTTVVKNNKELSILKLLNHENVVRLFCFSCDDVRKHCVEDNTKDENSCDHKSSTCRDSNLSLFLSFMPTTLHLHLENHGPILRGKSLDKMKLGFSFVNQLFIALEYIRSLNICHRDIKPANILLDIDHQNLKLSDFGSAIQLSPNKHYHDSEQTRASRLQSYVCSRYYRAPELILGSEKYGCEIDIWSAGCVVAEMVTAKPLFPGESSMDMLVEIVSLLGPPSLKELKLMDVNLAEDTGHDINIDDDDDDHDDDDNGIKCSSLMDLILSIRTFKSYNERLKDKLEHSTSGRIAVSTEIVDIISNSLQYVASHRIGPLAKFEPDLFIEK